MPDSPILLREWRSADAPVLLEMYRDAPDLERQFAAPLRSLADARDLIAGRFVTEPSRVNAAIQVAGRAVGNVALTDIRREGAHAGTAWVSYFSSASVRGRGLVGRSCAALCTWALRDLGLDRLELAYRVNNPASAAVARRAGFVVEGLERQKLVYDGIRYDVQTCARLASDPAPEAGAVEIAISGGSSA
jgi:[ribosomal protein S5]-alanine N-acetyltransferase